MAWDGPLVSAAENTAQKQQIGWPFEPDQSGNPAGQPKGSRNKATLAVEALLDGEAEEITRKVIELAKKATSWPFVFVSNGSRLREKTVLSSLRCPLWASQKTQ